MADWLLAILELLLLPVKLATWPIITAVEFVRFVTGV